MHYVFPRVSCRLSFFNEISASVCISRKVRNQVKISNWGGATMDFLLQYTVFATSLFIGVMHSKAVDLIVP